MSEKSSGDTEAKLSALKLVALHDADEDLSDPCRKPPDPSHSTNHFKSAQWSADGTSVITNSADNQIRTFIIPPELLESRAEPLTLTPYARIVNHDPTDAVTIYPGFDLQDVTTTLVLSAVNEHPIRLNSALTSDLVASYPLVNASTEAFVKPQCLTFTRNGSHFIAGSDNLISIFDLSRPGQEPVLSTRTGPRRSKSPWSNPAVSMRGPVSAIQIDKEHSILAAGTLTRHVGLYDTGGFGECLGVFAVQDTGADQQIGGSGITQLLWSPCGRYLYIAERKSDGAMIYDIRNTGQLVGWLVGRQANTNQRLHLDLATIGTDTRHEIWAGGTDGRVRVWKDPHFHEGAIAHSEERLVHDDAVNSTSLHHSGSVLLTAAGQRHLSHLDDPSKSGSPPAHDVSLKLWSLPTMISG